MRPVAERARRQGAFQPSKWSLKVVSLMSDLPRLTSNICGVVHHQQQHHRSRRCRRHHGGREQAPGDEFASSRHFHFRLRQTRVRLLGPGEANDAVGFGRCASVLAVRGTVTNDCIIVIIFLRSIASDAGTVTMIVNFDFSIRRTAIGGT